MFYQAKNGTVRIGDSDMDYISFGNGNKILIMLPGLGDGLSTVKGTALAFSMAYRVYAKKYKVYVFSRKNDLPKGYTTRKMAADQAQAMRALGITKAYILGISQGGMIAQYLAIDFPDLVEKLVLAVTLSRQNELMQAAAATWMKLAKQGNYKELMIDTAEKSYSKGFLRKYKLLYPLLGKLGKPKNFDRFLIQANSCILHNAYTELEHILCPVLIIGGNEDKIVGVTASYEIADRIRDSELYIYQDFGHAVYEEARDFNERVMRFLPD